MEEARHADLMKEIDNTLNLKHPVVYGIYDLCCYVWEEMLKKMCTHFEISFCSTDKKADLLKKLQEIIMSCQCYSER